MFQGELGFIVRDDPWSLRACSLAYCTVGVDVFVTSAVCLSARAEDIKVIQLAVVIGVVYTVVIALIIEICEIISH